MIGGKYSIRIIDNETNNMVHIARSNCIVLAHNVTDEVNTCIVNFNDCNAETLMFVVESLEQLKQRILKEHPEVGVMMLIHKAITGGGHS